MKQSSDIALVEQLVAGQERALSALMDAYRGRLRAFMMRSLPQEEDVESLVQEVFLKVWLNRATLDKGRPFEAYLFTVAKHIVIDHLRKLVHKRRFIQDAMASPQSMEQSASEVIEYDELKSKVEAAVLQMPEKRRRIFVMHRFEGKKIQRDCPVLGY
ncbi:MULTISPECIES: RNA polymerase sigma factor [unclassified Carboxylicivirga]|uniref:RNA polymerase sigma factor n=1 Tax=Carboxylicivirga TaxID=1628153 RepID=UPI003D3291A6